MKYRVRPLEVEALRLIDWESGIQIADLLHGRMMVGSKSGPLHIRYRDEEDKPMRMDRGDYYVPETGRVWRGRDFELVHEEARTPIVLGIDGNRVP